MTTFISNFKFPTSLFCSKLILAGFVGGHGRKSLSKRKKIISIHSKSMVHLKNELLCCFSWKWVTLMVPYDQTEIDRGILFLPSTQKILGYKNPEFELDPFTLKFDHHLTPQGTENKRNTFDPDFYQTSLKRWAILNPLKQKKDRRVALTRS